MTSEIFSDERILLEDMRTMIALINYIIFLNYLDIFCKFYYKISIQKKCENDGDY